MDGPAVTLVTGDHLGLDIDDFDTHIDAAARAEANGASSLCVEHNHTATRLYRSKLHADLPDADWFTIDREHYRTRFVNDVIRAGQLSSVNETPTKPKRSPDAPSPHTAAWNAAASR